MFASDSLWVLGEIGAVMCVFVPLLVLTLDPRGHAEFALQRRDARYMQTFLSANGSFQPFVSAAGWNRDLSGLARAANGRLRLFLPALRDICVDGTHLRDQDKQSGQDA